MGGCDFEVEVTGKTAQEAFDSARKEAQWDHGHSGYTGTIAEKGDFVMFTLPEGENPYKYIERVFEEDDEIPERLQQVAGDKWGPAACFQLAPDRWLFFGIASC